MPDWVERPVHQAIYAVERMVASVGWGFDRSGLYLCELIERFRTALVTGGFTPAIESVSTSVLGISKPAFELAFALGMLCLMLTPLVTLRFFNVRNALFLALLIPIALPVAGSIFQTLEQARADLGNSFYETVFRRSSFDLLPANEENSGASANMGPLVSYQPTVGCCRALDVAAAYLYANRQDVLDPAAPPPEDLPDEFERQFFGLSMEQFGELPAEVRWEQIRRSSEGITRTFYGFILIIFAFLESLTNLAFTVALGFLLIALLISCLFVWLAPFESVTYVLARRVFELMIASWGISVLQGLMLAAVIDVARGANAFATLGIGLLALVLQIVFLFIGAKTIMSAVMGVASAATGGSAEREFRQATGMVAGGVSAMGGAVLGAAGGTVLGAGAAKLAYGVARQEGGTRRYALGAALGQYRPMARLGTLAAAMGAGGTELGGGLVAEQRTKVGRAIRYDQAMRRRPERTTQGGAQKPHGVEANTETPKPAEQDQTAQEPSARWITTFREAGVPTVLAGRLAIEVAKRGQLTPELHSRAVTALQARQGLSEAAAQTALEQLLASDPARQAPAPTAATGMLDRQALQATIQAAGISPAMGQIVEQDLLAAGQVQPDTRIAIIGELIQGGKSPQEAQAAVDRIQTTYGTETHVPVPAGAAPVPSSPSGTPAPATPAARYQMTPDEHAEYAKLMGAARKTRNPAERTALRAQASAIRRGHRAAQRETAQATAETMPAPAELDQAENA